ncbi:hypothetical protein ACCO45_004851 [Purpureocillium lilacinum]|uniref:Uncharacterized protein n=1 Tax=Purpureocillium lilacinum TaxID=33203 RepID=A0ACC4DTS5_PURLI
MAPFLYYGDGDQQPVRAGCKMTEKGDRFPAANNDGIGQRGDIQQFLGSAARARMTGRTGRRCRVHGVPVHVPTEMLSGAGDFWCLVGKNAQQVLHLLVDERPSYLGHAMGKLGLLRRRVGILGASEGGSRRSDVEITHAPTFPSCDAMPSFRPFQKGASVDAGPARLWALLSLSAAFDGHLGREGGGAARSWEWKFRSPWALIHWRADTTGCSSITRARLDKASDALQGDRAGLRSGASRRVWIWTRWAGSLLYGYGSFPAVGNKRDRDGFNTTHARHACRPGTNGDLQRQLQDGAVTVRSSNSVERWETCPCLFVVRVAPCIDDIIVAVVGDGTRSYCTAPHSPAQARQVSVFGSERMGPLAPAAGWRAGSWCPVDNLHWKKQFHGGREPASAALGTEYKVPPGKAL